MKHINIKQSSDTETFLTRFSDDKRSKVAQYLMEIGIDMAKKLGHQPGTSELYKILSQLAKNIEIDSKKHEHNHDLKGEIRKIQDQITRLNHKFSNDFIMSKLSQQKERNHHGQSVNVQNDDQWEEFPEYSQRRNFQKSLSNQSLLRRDSSSPQFAHFNDQEFYNQKQIRNSGYHEIQSPQNYRINSNRQNDRHQDFHNSHQDFHNSHQVFSDRQYKHPSQFSFERNNHPSLLQFERNRRRMFSPKQKEKNSQNLTAKITESPPPPILYIQNMNTNVNVRRHLDDHQIKKLMYGDQHDDRRHSYNHYEHQQDSTPKSIRYSIPFQSNTLYTNQSLNKQLLTHGSSKKNIIEQAKKINYSKNKMKDSIKQQQLDQYEQEQEYQQYKQQQQQQQQQQQYQYSQQQQEQHQLQQQSHQKSKFQQQQQQHNRQKKKVQMNVPSYLKNVQSKIKNQVQQHKLIHSQQSVNRNEQEEDNYYNDEDQQDNYNREQQDYDQNQDQNDEDNNHLQQSNDQNIDEQNERNQYGHQTANFEEKNIQTQNLLMSKNQLQSMPNSSKSETYYDIQQYLIDQKNSKQFSFSPVQEMNTVQEERKAHFPDFTVSNQKYEQGNPGRRLFQQVSDFQFQQKNDQQQLHNSNFQKKKGLNSQDQSPPFLQSSQKSSHLYTQSKTFQNESDIKQPYQRNNYVDSSKQKVANLKVDYNEDSSDTFSNFTPPNKEVREFFQKQFAQNDKSNEGL